MKIINWLIMFFSKFFKKDSEKQEESPSVKKEVEIEKIEVEDPEVVPSYVDDITLKRIKKCHPIIEQEVLKIYHEINKVLTGKATIRFTHTLRTFEQQNKLYAKGRTAPGNIVTWVKGGFSYHNYGLAVDIVLLIDGNGDGRFKQVSWKVNEDYDNDLKADWLEAVAIFEKYGWEWGGRWTNKKDYPHFQKTFGYSTRQLLNMKKDERGYPIIK